MRFTVILVVLFAIVMVTVAIKPSRKLKKQAKMAAKLQMECDVVTWEACNSTEQGKITQSVTTNTSNPACVGTVVDATTVHKTMDCVATMERKGKRCSISIVRDFTPCGVGSEFYTLNKSIDCPTKTHKNKKSTIQRPCNMRIQERKRQRGAGAGAAKSKLKGLRKEKKMLRKKLAGLKKIGCVYEKSACTNKRMTWTRTTGDETTCDQTVEGPCLGFAKKNNRRSKGGKKRRQ